MSTYWIIISSLAFAQALVNDAWSFSPTPPNGLEDVTFPFNIADAPHESGYYFAQQFNFIGIQDVGYTGVQPRPNNSDGQSIVHGVFSTFQGGSTTKHPNCHSGADGGAGVSCAVDIVGDYKDDYHCIVENIGNTTWRGTLFSTATGANHTIGEWTLPGTAKGIAESQVGFMEYYPWNSQNEVDCSSAPKTAVTFGTPSSKTKGAGPGNITSVYADDCGDQAGFQKQKTSDGWYVTLG